VKASDDVHVARFSAVSGADLDRLRDSLRDASRALDEQARETGGARGRQEAGALRRFVPGCPIRREMPA
jgi:hypothetical protein